MKRRNVLGIVLTLGLVAVGASVALADELADIKSKGTLRVAIDLGSPPFGMHDADMKPAGSEVESAQALADYLGVKLEIIEVTGANRIPFLLSNKTDLVMASLSITDERKKVVDFSDPYAVIQIVVAAPANVEIKTVDDLKGKTIATARGTTNDQELTKQAPDANIVRYDDDATLVTALASGQNQIMCSAPQIMAAINQRLSTDPLEPKIVLKINPYAVGMRKGEDALRAAVNDWVHTDLKNGKLNGIYKKYNNVDLPKDMIE